MTAQSTNPLEELYPVPVLRATNISRMEEKRLGNLNLDCETAQFLGEENVSLFAGGCDNLDRLISRLRSLDECGVGGRWVVVPSTRKMSAVVFQRWLDADDIEFVDPQDVPGDWISDRLIFSVPESLSTVADDLIDSGVEVAGILVLDMFCSIHKARGFSNGNFRVHHDRPQLIVNFRSRLSRGSWTPPLVFFAQKPAKSINTNAMLSPYCLEAFRYVDGARIRMGLPPADAAGRPHTTGRKPAFAGNAA